MPHPHLIDAVAAALKRGVMISAAAAALIFGTSFPRESVGAAAAGAAALPPARKHADFAGVSASADARVVADWVMAVGDNGQQPFVIVDKKQAQVFVFQPDGRLLGATPVLLGSATGDHTVPGIGERPLADVLPEERTTPAGRFVAERGRNTSGDDILWVDYDAAVSMHRVRPSKKSERRLERLASVTAADNRISYGCINLPVAFFNSVLWPSLQARRGIVYVLPEVKTLAEAFPGFGGHVADAARQTMPSQPRR